MTRRNRSPSRLRRFTIVMALCSLAAGGMAFAVDPNSFATDRDGSRIGRPGNGPGHDFVDRAGVAFQRMMQFLDFDGATRLFSRNAGSCYVCPAPPPVVERPLPPPRENRNRPSNQGPQTSSPGWMFPR